MPKVQFVHLSICSLAFLQPFVLRAGGPQKSMILVFASSKGGVGKSTTCAALGAGLALEGQRVLILDLDQNRTVHRWSRKTAIPGLTV